jgi:hypothetical protein
MTKCWRRWHPLTGPTGDGDRLPVAVHPDASSFLVPIEATVDKIMHDARQHMH